MDELDPTTERIVTELSSQLAPQLAKALAPAIPTNELLNALESSDKANMNFISQVERAIESGVNENRESQNSLVQSTGRMLEEIFALRQILENISDSLANDSVQINQESTAPAPDSEELLSILEKYNKANHDLALRIEKSVRSVTDENRATRSILVQSMSNLLEEIFSLKRSVESTPKSLEEISKSVIHLQSPQNNHTPKHSEQVLTAISKLSEEFKRFNEKLDELSKPGKKTPQKEQAQPENGPSDGQHFDKLLNDSMRNFEGLLRAHNNSQTRELDSLSQELTALHEQNNLAITHKLQEIFIQEYTKSNGEIAKQISNEVSKLEQSFSKLSRTLRFIMILSASALVISLISIFLR